MYSRCLACERRLGSNSRLPHLPIGNKIAFDPELGRLWVICPHCRQWNLAPFEERWEALEECEAEFAGAESHVATDAIALAKCGNNLELLRIGGDARPSDIANYRYGQRLNWRRTRLEVTAIALGTLALTGLGALLLLMPRARNPAEREGDLLFIVWWVVVIGAYFPWLLRRGPALAWLTSLRIAARYRGHDGTRLTILNRHVRKLEIDAAGENDGAALTCRYHGRNVRFDRHEAAELLAAILPRVNWLAGDPGTVKHALRLAHRAEVESDAGEDGTRKSWQWLVRDVSGRRLLTLPPATLLALEIVATEEHELRLMRGEALSLRLAWKKEEGIAAIADALLLPAFVTDWIARFKARRNDPASPPPR